MMHGRTSKALGTVETSNYSYQTKAPLNEALGTVETPQGMPAASIIIPPTLPRCLYLRCCSTYSRSVPPPTLASTQPWLHFLPANVDRILSTLTLSLTCAL